MTCTSDGVISLKMYGLPQGCPWNLHGHGEDQEVFRWTQIDALRSLRDVDEKRARRRFLLRTNRPCRSEDGKATNHQEAGSDDQTRLRALQNACADWRVFWPE
jgi:hypothetical protein